MASMVAKVCSSISSQMPAMTVQEKGSRNKRKFRGDPPLADPSKVIPLPLDEFASFEFTAEKFDSNEHSNKCDMCCVNQDTSDALKLDLGLSCRPEEEIEASGNEFPDADWNDLTEFELEELVLRNLDTIFKNTIKKIVASGYSEEVAKNAILRSGLWYDCKYAVLNIFDNALAFLKSGREIDPSTEHYFEDLQQMEKHILADLVCLLREVRPFFSTGDAMWCLLICDLNVLHACAIDGDSMGVSQSRTEFKSSEPNGGHSLKFQASSKGTDAKPKTSFASNGLVPDVDSQHSTSSINEKPFVGSRKVSGIAKREYILRQKSMQFEKYRHSLVSRGTSRVGKFSSFGGLAYDKKLKGVADSTDLTAKDDPVKENGFDIPADGISSNLPSPSLPVANTELSLTFPAETIANPMPISYNIEDADCSYSEFSNNNSTEQWAPQDRKDEMIMKLITHMRELQNQLQEWTEWANQKVMQAARRLSKDKAELKTLRQEKEEVERLKKEKQTLEENTVKKLSEIETALRKAGGQAECTHGAVRRLEVENKVLRREMETAKLHAAESAASCQEVLEREKNTTMKFQLSEKQKMAFQEEFSAEKFKLMQMQREVQQAKDVLNQVEDKLNREQKAKDDLLMQISSLRKECEQIELSTQSKEDTIKSRGERKLHKYKEDIATLEKEITKLRMKTESSKIAALRNIRYTPILNELKTTSDIHDFSVKRERECVMCLSEEMSVVFLPCTHQVVCTTCNELHEKQGMKECPSCRSPIQKRISVRYAHS